MDVPPMQKLSPRQRELEAMKQPATQHVRVCDTCRGEGGVMGAVMRLTCIDCDGLGFLMPTGERINRTKGGAQAMARELYATRKRLSAALNSLAPSTGPERSYYGNNGRGAGGSNFTGD